MNFYDLIYIRHEVLLTVAIALVMIAGSYRKYFSAKSLTLTFTGLFLLVTGMGFLPLPDGTLFGGMFITSYLPGIMKNILNTATLIVLLQSFSWFSKTQNPGKIRNYFVLIFASLLGIYLMLSAGHFIILYLGLELASLPLAVAAAYADNEKTSSGAGIRILMVSVFSSALILFGISMTYGICGTLYFSELISINMNNTLQVFAFFFILAGILVKISVAPFNLLSRGIFERAPAGIALFIIVVSTSSAIFILLILLYSIFPSISLIWQKSIFVLSIVGITTGNILALKQKNIRSFIVWSSSVQAGYIILGLIGISPLAMASVIYYTLACLFSTLVFVIIVSAVTGENDRANINDLRGLYHSNPGLGIAMILALLSLAGIPPLAGFFGRFFVFAAAAGKGFYFLLLITTANTLITLYYYLTFIRTIFSSGDDGTVPAVKTDLAVRLALVLSVAVILFGGLAGSLFDKLNDMSFGI